MDREHKPIGANHVAGIIPVAGQPLDFNFPWHDCMQPIAKNFLAIERAVLECATAGCKTIWIICPTHMQPLLRKRVGEYIHDPVLLLKMKYKRFSNEVLRPIPIYYIPTHPKDKRKRDSLIWSILYGAKVVHRISSSISKWLIPTKFYITFPYAVFPSQFVRKYRRQIVHAKRFFASFNGKTIRDGEFLPCAIPYTDIKNLKKEFLHLATGLKTQTDVIGNKLETLEFLPIEERYSGRFLKVQDVFSSLSPEGFNMEVIWYHNISSWEGFCGYLGSEDRKKMQRPIRKMLFPHGYWSGLNNYDDSEST